MPYETFPTFTVDPDFRSWKEGVANDSVITSPYRAGRTKMRARFTFEPYQWSFTYPFLTQADKQTLQLFETLVRGNRFYWQNFQEAYGADAWEDTTGYTVGKVVQPVTPNGRSYKCTIAGTSHVATEPTWPTTVNATVVDGSVTWTENTYLVRFEGKIDFNSNDAIHMWSASMTLVRD
jgi:hypothetical protein